MIHHNRWLGEDITVSIEARKIRVQEANSCLHALIAASSSKLLRPASQPPRAVGDLRKILDDKSVDAVIIATPDHWHSPAAILAVKAGKHVYVEKPISHNIREGRLLVQTAERTKRLVQHGTQPR